MIFLNGLIMMMIKIIILVLLKILSNNIHQRNHSYK